MQSYLYSLEQEVSSLRAQVVALTSDHHNTVGQMRRGIAFGAAQAMNFVRPDLRIDSQLSGEYTDGPLRSPWDTPGAQSGNRRHSDFANRPIPRLVEHPRSPFPSSRPHPTGQPAVVLTSSLTRMVHDAALGTGHAQNHIGVLNAAGPSSITGSERESDSPIAADSGDGGITSPRDLTPRSGGNGIRHPPSPSPLGTGLSNQSKPKPRAFNIPTLPPQPAVERLVAAYVDFVGVSSPMVHIPTLGKQLIKIREGRDVEQSDIFVVSMVLGRLTLMKRVLSNADVDSSQYNGVIAFCGSAG